MLKYQSEFSGIPVDSLKKHPNAMVKEVTDHQLYKDFLNFNSNPNTIFLQNRNSIFIQSFPYLQLPIISDFFLF